jgi:hypothetical protein
MSATDSVPVLMTGDPVTFKKDEGTSSATLVTRVFSKTIPWMSGVTPIPTPAVMLNLAVVGSGAISLMVAIRRGMHEASIEPMGHIGSTRERDGTTVATNAPVMSSSEIASTTGMMNMLYVHFFFFLQQ